VTDNPSALDDVPNRPKLKDCVRRMAHALERTSDAPWIDAQRLAGLATGMTTAQLIAHGERQLDIATHDQLKGLLARRAAGEPLAYILGNAGFWRYELSISTAVLIPRPETETLVELALEHLPHDAALRVADLGTGSGAIAVTLAAERPAWHITATDIEPSAIAIARTNADRYELRNIAFRVGDWLAAIDQEYFDAIVANPPYVAEDDPHLADPGLAAEPRRALVAADHGWADLKLIADQAPAALNAGGLLMLEHGLSQGPYLQSALEAAGFESIETLKDASGHPRVTRGYLTNLRRARCPRFGRMDSAS